MNLCNSWYELYFFRFLPSIGLIWFISTCISFHLATFLIYVPAIYLTVRLIKNNYLHIITCDKEKQENHLQMNCGLLLPPLLISIAHGILHYFFVYDLETVENHSFVDLILHFLMLIYTDLVVLRSVLIGQSLKLLTYISYITSILSLFLFFIRHSGGWIVFQLFRWSNVGHAISSGLFVSGLLFLALPFSAGNRNSKYSFAENLSMNISGIYTCHLFVSLLSFCIMMCLPDSAVEASFHGRYYESFFIIPCLLIACRMKCDSNEDIANNVKLNLNRDIKSIEK